MRDRVDAISTVAAMLSLCFVALGIVLMLFSAAVYCLCSLVMASFLMLVAVFVIVYSEWRRK